MPAFAGAGKLMLADASAGRLASLAGFRRLLQAGMCTALPWKLKGQGPASPAKLEAYGIWQVGNPASGIGLIFFFTSLRREQ